MGRGKNPSGWHGLAVARDLYELFWLIDEEGDPYAAQIKPIKAGFVAFRVDEDERLEEATVSEKARDAIDEQDGWRFPDWEAVRAPHEPNRKILTATQGDSR